MPIFEYRCGECERAFEAFVTADRSAECPSCGSVRLVKQLSSPGMVGVSSESKPAAALPMGGGCGAGGAGCACRN
jgi:putative FmdB family regulatory protein